MPSDTRAGGVSATPARFSTSSTQALSHHKETWLRLLVIRHGFPRPQTQIPVYDEYGALVAVLDMGWEEIKLALDYEGDHHRNPVRFNKDIRRHDAVTELGWMDIRVTSRDTEGGIIGRLTAEWSRRT